MIKKWNHTLGDPPDSFETSARPEIDAVLRRSAEENRLNPNRHKLQQKQNDPNL